MEKSKIKAYSLPICIFIFSKTSRQRASSTGFLVFTRVTGFFIKDKCIATCTVSHSLVPKDSKKVKLIKNIHVQLCQGFQKGQINKKYSCSVMPKKPFMK